MQRVEKLKVEGKEVEGRDNFPNFASQPARLQCNNNTNNKHNNKLNNQRNHTRQEKTIATMSPQRTGLSQRLSASLSVSHQNCERVGEHRGDSYELWVNCGPPQKQAGGISVSWWRLLPPLLGGLAVSLLARCAAARCSLLGCSVVSPVWCCAFDCETQRLCWWASFALSRLDYGAEDTSGWVLGRLLKPSLPLPSPSSPPRLPLVSP